MISIDFKEHIEEDELLSKSVVKSMNQWASAASSDREMDAAMHEYRRTTFQKILFILICLVLIFTVSGLAITVGAYKIGLVEVYQTIIDHFFGGSQDTLDDYIVFELRMPRIIAGIIGGAGLAVCGVVMQSVLKNPLADPYTTGVSAGASFGATLVMSSGIAVAVGGWSIVANAFLFSLIPTALMIMIAKMRNASPTIVIMAGIGVMYIFNAFTTILMLWANPQDLAAIYRWQVGSLETITWEAVPFILGAVIPGIIAVQLLSSRLNVLLTGDESAKALGVHADRLRIVCLLLVCLISASIVSFTGIIGFVGLVSPHIVRIFVGADNKYLIPASAAFGGMLLVLADMVGRVVLAPVILQVGVVMALIGGPLFIWLIMKRNRNVWG